MSFVNGSCLVERLRLLSDAVAAGKVPDPEDVAELVHAAREAADLLQRLEDDEVDRAANLAPGCDPVAEVERLRGLASEALRDLQDLPGSPPDLVSARGWLIGIVGSGARRGS